MWARSPYAGGPSNRAIAARWLRRPDVAPGAEVCLFVTIARGGAVAPHALFHARAWAEAGFRTVVIVVADDLDSFVDDGSLDFAAGVLLRRNRGYDFGAWAGAINRLPALKSASLVALVNDSLLGPFSTFCAMLARVRASDADFLAATESLEVTRHFQSFLMFFKPTALRSKAFRSFWRGIRSGDRDFVIDRYELRLLGRMEAGGLKCEALYVSNPTTDTNPTLMIWDELVDAGFPYVKVKLLTDNPYRLTLDGWPDRMRQWGFDPALALPLLPPAAHPMVGAEREHSSE